MVASNPPRHQTFLKAFIGAGEVESNLTGVAARTENGDIEILQPAAFRNRYGVRPEPIGEGMTLNAVRFAVADVSGIAALHRENGIASRQQAGGLVVTPDAAHGATLIFEKA